MTASEHRFGQVWYRVLFDVVIVIGVDLQICRAGVLFFFLLRRLFFISLFLQISWLRAQLFFEEHPLSFKSRRQIITADSCTFSSVASGVSFWNSDPSKYRSWFSGAVHVESNRRRFLQGPTPPDDHPAANMLRSPSAPPPSSALLHPWDGIWGWWSRVLHSQSIRIPVQHKTTHSNDQLITAQHKNILQIRHPLKGTALLRHLLQCSIDCLTIMHLTVIRSLRRQLLPVALGDSSWQGRQSHYFQMIFTMKTLVSEFKVERSCWKLLINWGKSTSMTNLLQCRHSCAPP